MCVCAFVCVLLCVRVCVLCVCVCVCVCVCFDVSVGARARVELFSDNEGGGTEKAGRMEKRRRRNNDHNQIRDWGSPLLPVLPRPQKHILRTTSITSINFRIVRTTCLPHDAPRS